MTQLVDPNITHDQLADIYNRAPIHNWSVKRSGARMTLTGTDKSGAPVKVSVDAVRGGHGVSAFAVDRKTGHAYRLLP